MSGHLYIGHWLRNAWTLVCIDDSRARCTYFWWHARSCPMHQDIGPRMATFMLFQMSRSLAIWPRVLPIPAWILVSLHIVFLGHRHRLLSSNKTLSENPWHVDKMDQCMTACLTGPCFQLYTVPCCFLCLRFTRIDQEFNPKEGSGGWNVTSCHPDLCCYRVPLGQFKPTLHFIFWSSS